MKMDMNLQGENYSPLQNCFVLIKETQQELSLLKQDKGKSITIYKT